MAILRIEPNIVDDTGNFTFNSVVATANVSAGNVAASAYYFANGTPLSISSFGNTEVGAYIAATYPIVNDGDLLIGSSTGPDVYIDALNTVYIGHDGANYTTVTFDGHASFDSNATFTANATITGGANLTINNQSNITVKSGAAIHLLEGAYLYGYDAFFSNINVTGSANIGNITATGFYFANGTPFVSSTYGNAEVGAYLLVDSTITGLQANAAFQANLIDILSGNAATQGSLLDVLVANAAEQSANLTSLLSNAAAQEASLTSLVSNAASQSGAIDSINANVGAYQIYANANAATQATSINTLNANVGAYQIWANANAASQSTAFNTLDANVGAYEIWANANLATQTTNFNTLYANVGAYQTYANANAASQSTAFNTLDANVGAYQVWANANVASQNTAFNTLNANVGAYQIWANANAASQSTAFNTLDANVGAYQVWANANLATQTTNYNTLYANVGAYEVWANANLATQTTNYNTLYANVGAYQIWANANLATQTTNINTVNANVAAANVEIALKAPIANPQFTGTVFVSNLVVSTNLLVQGNTVTIGSENLTVSDSIINLHTFANLAPLTGDDGRDIGLAFHYYKGTDNVAFLGWANDSGSLEYYAAGTETGGNVFAGTAYGTIKSGEFVAANNTPSTSTTSGALRVTGGAGIQGNLYVDKLFTDTHNYANGVSILSDVYSSITGANAAIVTANTGLKSYVDAQDTAITNAWTANAAAQATAIDTLNANVGAYEVWANANLATQTTNFNTLDANVGAYQTWANANAAAQQTSIDSVNANIGAYQTYANANAATQATSIDSINANIGAYQTYANANAATQQTSIDTLQTQVYSNVNAAAYLAGNVTTGNVFTNGVFYANGRPYGNIAIRDEGTTITNAVSSINFVGSGVSAVATGSNVTVTVTGGGGGGGASLVFTASSSPLPSGNNPGDQWYNTTSDTLYEYVYDGVAYYWVDITTPVTGNVSTGYVNRKYTATGTGNTYTVSTGCTVFNVMVYLNGVAQMPSDDYTISGTTLTVDGTPDVGTVIQIRELPR